MRGAGGVHQRLCGKMWHRLKEGERLGRGIRNEREAEKKPSSQKQLSMTVRGQTTGEEEDPEQGLSRGMSWMFNLWLNRNLTNISASIN